MAFTQVRREREDLSTPEEIGDKLRTWRNARGLTIEDLAYELRVGAPEFLRFGREFVRRYEAGSFSRENLNLPYIVAVCAVLEHSPSELGDDVRQAYERLLQLVAGMRTTPEPTPPPTRSRKKTGAGSQDYRASVAWEIRQPAVESRDMRRAA